MAETTGHLNWHPVTVTKKVYIDLRKINKTTTLRHIYMCCECWTPCKYQWALRGMLMASFVTSHLFGTNSWPSYSPSNLTFILCPRELAGIRCTKETTDAHKPTQSHSLGPCVCTSTILKLNKETAFYLFGTNKKYLLSLNIVFQSTN